MEIGKLQDHASFLHDTLAQVEENNEYEKEIEKKNKRLVTKVYANEMLGFLKRKEDKQSLDNLLQK